VTDAPTARLFEGGNISYANMTDPRQSVVLPPYGTDAQGLPLRQLVDVAVGRVESFRRRLVYCISDSPYKIY
jgi:hypothetical protein